MTRYGFRRNPLTKDPKHEDPTWRRVWQSGGTVICHATTRDKALSWADLKAYCVAYDEQEDEEVPTEEQMALDLVRLVEVGLVLVEPLP